ncbi:GAF domain-containing sensor histidine kinase [bacterium]|nr:GAF domain-containing sensor histidine kinase [bacterium]
MWGKRDDRSKDPVSGGEETRRAASASQSASDTVAEREMTLRSLVELSNDLNARMDLYDIADVAVFNVMGHFGCSRAALWYLGTDDSSEAVLLRRSGIPDQTARAVGSLWARWLRSGALTEPMLIDDLRSTGSVPGLDLAAGGGITLIAPVTARTRLVGLMALGERISGKRFSARDVDALSASLNFAGTALENAAAANRMAENNRQLTLANDRLRSLDDLKSEFLRNLNHELRTPLTIIAAYSDSLLMSEPEDSPRREHYQALKTETSKLESMMMTLLDFSKLVRNEESVDCSLGDVVHTLRAYSEERRPGIAAGLRELRFSHQSDVPHALFEPVRLAQILDSLVDNAVKFCPPGSSILIRVETDEDRVLIEVRDNGPGIPAERLPHIWDSFRQGDGSETRTHGGMGMGLAFARELATRMNATLDVKSATGEGTAFSL